MIRIDLAFRNIGTHSLVKSIEVHALDFDALVSDPDGRPVVDEDALLAALPSGFLPSKPRAVLLMVGDEGGATAVSTPTHFRPWGKYFSAYSLTVCRAGVA